MWLINGKNGGADKIALLWNELDYKTLKYRMRKSKLDKN